MNKKKKQKVRNRKIIFILILFVTVGLLIVLGIKLNSGLLLLIGMAITIIFVGYLFKWKGKVGWKGLAGILTSGMIILTFCGAVFNRVGYELNTTAMFGQGEVQVKVAGFVYGEDTASWTDNIKRGSKWTYIDGIKNQDVTTSYSHTPEKRIGTWNYVNMDSFSWNIDPLGTTSYYPNMLGTTMKPYASDVDGNELDKYDVTNRTTVFTDKNGEKFNVEIYSTFLTVQVELEARADADFNQWTGGFGNMDFVSQDSMAEVSGWFENTDGDKQYLGNYAADFEYVFQISSSTFTYKDLTHGFKPTFTKNAVIGAAIEGYQVIIKVRDETMLIGSQAIYQPLSEWRMKPYIDYIQAQKPIPIYQTCRDAFFDDDSIERTELGLIDMDDIWDDTIYIKLPFYARLGFDVEDYWALKGSKYSTIEYTYSAKVLYDITFEVINSYGAPINPEADAKDLFDEAKKEGTDITPLAIVLSWLNEFWNGAGKKIFYAIIALVVILIVFCVVQRARGIARPLRTIFKGIAKRRDARK